MHAPNVDAPALAKVPEAITNRPKHVRGERIKHIELVTVRPIIRSDVRRDKHLLAEPKRLSCNPSAIDIGLMDLDASAPSATSECSHQGRAAHPGAKVIEYIALGQLEGGQCRDGGARRRVGITVAAAPEFFVIARPKRKRMMSQKAVEDDVGRRLILRTDALGHGQQASQSRWPA
jgi:hypothetical protein